MHDFGPIYVGSARPDNGDVKEDTRVPILCDDAEHFARTLRDMMSSGKASAATAEEISLGASVTLTCSFPGLLRALHFAGKVESPPATASAPAPISSPDSVSVTVALSGLDGVAEKTVNELLGKIEAGDPNYVARAVRVLVVEDNPHCAKLIQEGLHLAGRRAFGNRVVFDVPMASNAADAFTFLHSRPIDVLITDIYLGGVSGTTVIEHVRNDAALRGIPVIAISAGDEATRQVALDAGADVFLPKPVRLRQIVGTVGEVLKLEQVAWR